ncbi:hypothetical protein [Halosimplex halophilum]|uniref:hypothetical protein n=1 Tax=Halosimplex halophilum TaxID=2559572 RepID=UPI0014355326|nr:hypothetical protein [Halosimplex halophilum]
MVDYYEVYYVKNGEEKHHPVAADSKEEARRKFEESPPGQATGYDSIDRVEFDHSVE